MTNELSRKGSRKLYDLLTRDEHPKPTPGPTAEKIAGLHGAVGEKATAIIETPIDSCRPNPEQPRKSFDEAALQQLMESIRERNVLQPIIVTQRQSGNEKYFLIVVGERRWRASKALGKPTIPAIRMDLSDQEVYEIALEENIKRADLKSIELALAAAGMKKRDYSVDKIALMLSGGNEAEKKGKSWVYSMFKIAGSLNKSETALALELPEIGFKKLLSLEKLPKNSREDALKMFGDGKAIKEVVSSFTKKPSPKPQETKSAPLLPDQLLSDIVARFKSTLAGSQNPADIEGILKQICEEVWSFKVLKRKKDNN